MVLKKSMLEVLLEPITLLDSKVRVVEPLLVRRIAIAAVLDMITSLFSVVISNVSLRG
jgi:hypothetical protein